MGLSECYFAGKATAYVLSPHEQKFKERNRSTSPTGNDIQKHLQSMFYLLREEDTLKMAVKLESVHTGRTRYLVVVSRLGKHNIEESCLLGIDCNEKTTVGLVLKVLADTSITLDGDGGFSVSVCGRHHIFKPVSVQAMWSALQTLHKISAKARECNFFENGFSHDWVQNYEQSINSDRSCLNEWHAMDNLESKRPPSPDSVRIKPSKRDETESVIKSTLKDIMMSVDIDEVTSKYIRTKLEEELDMDLGEYKPFIDQEMLTILGQMDAPTEIFNHLFLGSEWNASNLEELQKNRIGHILNVTREIDNFFPGMFDYMNIRVLDDDKTDLLKYWDKTYKYITKAKKEGSRVLVHCKMGISRSASVVIAYAMKSYNWDLKKALKYVKNKRNCVKPNQNFITQLETYQGILDAMKNREKLQRSKSENNLQSGSSDLENTDKKPMLRANSDKYVKNDDLCDCKLRCKSWSPDQILSYEKLPIILCPPIFLSLENLKSNDLTTTAITPKAARRVLMPCHNGNVYSVSPNQIVHLPNNRSYFKANSDTISDSTSSMLTQKLVLDKVHKEKKGLVLNLTNQFETSCSKPNSPVFHKKSSDTCLVQNTENNEFNNVLQHPKASSLNNIATKSSRVLRKECFDLFSNNLDKMFNHEEVHIKPQQHDDDSKNSDRSSWSSFDSADDKQYRNTPSRHSSWCSGNTRTTLPTRNSSWGSYDSRSRNAAKMTSQSQNESTVCYLGTVRRTKARLEEKTVNVDSEAKIDGLSMIALSEPITNKIEIKKSAIKANNKLNSRLSVSAPERQNLLIPYMDQKSKLRAAKSCNDTSVLLTTSQNWSSSSQQKMFSNIDDNCNLHISQQQLGIVQNLKKEFEAKTSNNITATAYIQKNKHGDYLEVPEDDLFNNVVLRNNKKTANSAPSSPLSANKTDDISVKCLVDKYEDVSQIDLKTRKRSCIENRSFTKTTSSTNLTIRHSCFEIPSTIHERRPVTNFSSNKKDDLTTSKKRPPAVPGVIKGSLVITTTVFNKAAKRSQQQHGKSHPLSRLIVRPKQISSPVYNTM